MIVGRDELAAGVAGGGEREEERVGPAVRELHPDASPVLVGVVVHEGPALQDGLLPGVVEHQAVRRAPDGRLGDVPEGHGSALRQDVEQPLALRPAGGERVERGAQTRRVARVERADGAELGGGDADDGARVGEQEDVERRGLRGDLRGVPLRLRGRGRVLGGHAVLARLHHVDDASGVRASGGPHVHAGALRRPTSSCWRSSGWSPSIGRPASARAMPRLILLPNSTPSTVGLPHATEDDERLERVVHVARGERERGRVAPRELPRSLEVPDARLVEAQRAEREDGVGGPGVGHGAARARQRGQPDAREESGAGEHPARADSCRSEEFRGARLPRPPQCSTRSTVRTGAATCRFEGGVLAGCAEATPVCPAGRSMAGRGVCEATTVAGIWLS